MTDDHLCKSTPTQGNTPPARPRYFWLWGRISFYQKLPIVSQMRVRTYMIIVWFSKQNNDVGSTRYCCGSTDIDKQMLEIIEKQQKSSLWKLRLQKNQFQAWFGISQIKPETISGLIWYMPNQAWNNIWLYFVYTKSSLKFRLDLAYAKSSLKCFQAWFGICQIKPDFFPGLILHMPNQAWTHFRLGLVYAKSSLKWFQAWFGWIHCPTIVK